MENIAGVLKTRAKHVFCPSAAPARHNISSSTFHPEMLSAAAVHNLPSETERVHTDVTAIPGLRDLWHRTLGDPRICIAVLDGPVDLSHLSFVHARVKVIGDDPIAVGPAAEHGTHIASIIFGNHKGPVKGIAPNCSGVVIPIYRSRSDGTVEPCSQSNLARAIGQAIDYFKKSKAEALVINISGGQFSESGNAQIELKRAIADCAKRGVLVVAAAGNDGCDCLHVPSALPEVLTVGAMSINGEPLHFSNWGKKYVRQGILAVGENIIGASITGSTSIYSGTSFATPIVSGVAALLLSMQLKVGIRPSASEVRKAVVASARGCDISEAIDCRRLLAGRLSITQALKLLTPGKIATMTDPVNLESSPATVSASPCDTSRSASCMGIDRLEDPLVVPSVAPRPAIAQTAVAPSSCGCGGGAKTHNPVFAVGRLSYDFESITVRQAMQRRMKEDGGLVQDSAAFMRHLFRVNADGVGVSELNLHEASRFYWVLEYGRKPLYVIQPPQGATEGDDLKSIAYDYLEQQGLADAKRKLRLAKNEKPIESHDRPDYFAIAGYTNGETVTLLETGHTVPVLVPEYDLTDSWNLDALQSDAAEKGVLDKKDDGQAAQFRQILDLLHKFIEPLGDSAEKRAKNFVVSHAVLIAANSVAASSQQKLVLRSLDVIGNVGGRYPQEEVILIKAVFIDIAIQKDVEYAIDYYVNVSQPKPYLESQSPLGFA